MVQGVNDNQNKAIEPDAAIDPGLDIPMLRAALRLFDDRGFASADYSAQQAEICFHHADHEGQRWWHGLTYILDRKIAAAPMNRQGLDSLNSGKA